MHHAPVEIHRCTYISFKSVNMKLSRPILILLIIMTSSALLKGAEWFDPTSTEKKIQAEFSATALIPVGDFSDIYKAGFGGMLDISYVAQTQQNYRLSFRTGYIHLIAEEETEDGYDTGVSGGFIIPLLANYEYRLPMLWIERMKIAPSVSGGLSINRAVYDDRSGTISGGVPTGHAAVKDQTEVSIEPMFIAGLSFMYMVNWTDSIFLKSEFGTIYETDTPMLFGMINAGYEKRF